MTKALTREMINGYNKMVEAARGIKMALGNQVQWLGVRRKLI